VYQVRFSQNIASCSFQATIGTTGSVGTAGPGEIAVAGEAASANGVFLTTYSSAGALADKSFHLAVFC
jgi:hypothetical protein